MFSDPTRRSSHHRQLGLWLAAVLALPVPAAAQYFGKNKVNYKGLHWRVLETPHFEILFYDREDEIVEDAARMAERAYAQISATLGHTIDRRIPLVLYASHTDFQQTQITPGMIDIGTGGVTEFTRRRVFLPFTGSYGEFQHVLTHELVHAFEIDLIFESSQTDPINPFAYTPPLWMMEGLAEYLSRPKQDSQTEMWLRDGALNGHLLSIPALDLAQDIRVYRYGQSIFAYFAARYGERRIGELLRAVAVDRSLDKALQDVVGTRLDEFSQDWMTAVRREHLPALAAHRDPREFARKLVTRAEAGGHMLLVPSISPDGRRLAYVGDPGLTRDLYVRDLREGGVHRLVRGDVSADFEALRFFRAGTAWSPDSRTLAFAAQSGGADALYIIDVATGRIRTKGRFGLDELQTPTFSPDGKELIVVGIQQGRSDLYRVRADGTGLQALTHDRYAALDPRWSPDGRYVVYVSDEGPGTDPDRLVFGPLHLMLLDLETGERRDITPFRKGSATSPVWSGDGQYVAFISDQDGTPDIYILHVATGNVFRVTDSVTGVGGILPSSPALSWSNEGNRLVFSAFSRAGWDLYCIDNPQATMRPVQPAGGAENVVASMPAPDATLVSASAPLGSPAPADAGAVSTGTQPVVAGADAAGTMPMGADAAAAAPDTLPFRERRYRARLSPDLTQVGGVVGVDTGIGGASMLHFSDMLGNHNLAVGFGIYGSLKDSDFSLGYLNRSHRIAYELAGFQHQRRYGFLGTDGTEKQTYRGVQFSLHRPFDKFSRLETSLEVAGVRGRFFLGQTPGEEDPGIQEMRTYVGGGIAYVQDTALFGETGPILGRRMRLSVDAGTGELDFVTLQADVRRYWSLSPELTLAGRGFFAMGAGPTAQSFYLGGSSTLRGYGYGALVGTHAALGGAELRFPLLRYIALGWPLPLELANVRGVLFMDAASAWDGKMLRTSRAVFGERVGRGPQVAGGLGMRINLGSFVFRADWAQRYDTGTGTVTPGSSISIGADF